jgi:hypothetical protein
LALAHGSHRRDRHGEEQLPLFHHGGRSRGGAGLCFIDIHGATARAIADHAKRAVVYWKPSELDFIVGLNPLRNVPPDQRWMVADAIASGFVDIWNLGEHTPRLMNYLKAALMLLLENPGSTLLDIRPLLMDERKRKSLQCTDSQVRTFWADFDKKEKRQQMTEIESLLNKVDALTLPLPLRFILGQRISTLDIKRLMDTNGVLLVDLSGMGTDPARHLGAFIISQCRLAAASRDTLTDAQLEALPSFTLYIDEFEKFIQNSLPDMFSEVRKWKMALVVGHQFMSQLEDKLQDAIVDNVGTIVSFRVGTKSAPIIASAIDTAEQNIKDLGRGNAWVRLSHEGQPSGAIRINTSKARLRTGRMPAAIRNTRASYSRPRSVVERMLSR